MCNGTKTRWRCKCNDRSCLRNARGDPEPGHWWDTINYGAYFFCDEYILSGRYVIGYQGVPPCPKGITTDFETRFRNYLCPDCVDNGCPPIDHSIVYQDSAQKIQRKEREKVQAEERGRSKSRPRSASRSSSVDTIIPQRFTSEKPRPTAVEHVDEMVVTVESVLHLESQVSLKRDCFGTGPFGRPIEQVDSPRPPKSPGPIAYSIVLATEQASLHESQVDAPKPKADMWAAERAWRESQLGGLVSPGLGYVDKSQSDGGYSGRSYPSYISGILEFEDSEDQLHGTDVSVYEESQGYAMDKLGAEDV
ncbi:hypothetical protein BR93DRAFT_125210 [Coniochaeta sp. PMI_546]|nr:hypothetical protein BR93DRAFT_125210 [Coniochaeta sp. PMI_546]